MKGQPKDAAREFKEFMKEKDETVKAGTKQVEPQLDKLVLDSVKEFAASKGIALTDDETTSKALSGLSKQIGIQLNDMIVKSFTTLEGSMKQPIDMSPELIKVTKENEELYAECMHKADAAVREALKKCGKEMDAAGMVAFKEFSEKTGYQGPYPSEQFNKEIAKRRD